MWNYQFSWILITDLLFFLGWTVQNESRKRLGKSHWWESTIKDATARNQVASRSTVSAFKQTFCALRTVNVWIVRTLRGVKREGLFSMTMETTWPTSNRQPMLPLVGPLDPLAMGQLWHPRRENNRRSPFVQQPTINRIIGILNFNRYLFLESLNIRISSLFIWLYVLHWTRSI